MLDRILGIILGVIFYGYIIIVSVLALGLVLFMAIGLFSCAVSCKKLLEAIVEK